MLGDGTNRFGLGGTGGARTVVMEAIDPLGTNGHERSNDARHGPLEVLSNGLSLSQSRQMEASSSQSLLRPLQQTNHRSNSTAQALSSVTRPITPYPVSHRPQPGPSALPGLIDVEEQLRAAAALKESLGNQFAMVQAYEMALKFQQQGGLQMPPTLLPSVSNDLFALPSASNQFREIAAASLIPQQLNWEHRPGQDVRAHEQGVGVVNGGSFVWAEPSQESMSDGIGNGNGNGHIGSGIRRTNGQIQRQHQLAPPAQPSQPLHHSYILVGGEIPHGPTQPQAQPIASGSGPRPRGQQQWMDGGPSSSSSSARLPALSARPTPRTAHVQPIQSSSGSQPANAVIPSVSAHHARSHRDITPTSSSAVPMTNGASHHLGSIQQGHAPTQSGRAHSTARIAPQNIQTAQKQPIPDTQPRPPPRRTRTDPIYDLCDAIPAEPARFAEALKRLRSFERLARDTGQSPWEYMAKGIFYIAENETEAQAADWLVMLKDAGRGDILKNVVSLMIERNAELGISLVRLMANRTADRTTSTRDGNAVAGPSARPPEPMPPTAPPTETIRPRPHVIPSTTAHPPGPMAILARWKRVTSSIALPPRRDGMPVLLLGSSEERRLAYFAMRINHVVLLSRSRTDANLAPFADDAISKHESTFIRRIAAAAKPNGLDIEAFVTSTAQPMASFQHTDDRNAVRPGRWKGNAGNMPEVVPLATDGSTGSMSIIRAGVDPPQGRPIPASTYALPPDAPGALSHPMDGQPPRPGVHPPPDKTQHESAVKTESVDELDEFEEEDNMPDVDALATESPDPDNDRSGPMQVDEEHAVIPILHPTRYSIDPARHSTEDPARIVLEAPRHPSALPTPHRPCLISPPPMLEPDAVEPVDVPALEPTVNLRLVRHFPPDRCWIDVPPRDIERTPEPRGDPATVPLTPRHHQYYTPEVIPDRFDRQSDQPWLRRDITSRLSARPCGAPDCGAVLASESHLARHFRVRDHARSWEVVKTHPLEKTAFRCDWSGCPHPLYRSKRHLLQHVTAVHISRTLECPFREGGERSPPCGKICFTLTSIERHVGRAHPVLLQRTLVPMSTIGEETRRPPPRRVPLIPDVVPTAEVLPYVTFPSVWTTAARKYNAIVSIQDNCFIDRNEPRMSCGRSPQSMAVPKALPVSVVVDELGDEAGIPVAPGDETLVEGEVVDLDLVEERDAREVDLLAGASPEGEPVASGSSGLGLELSDTDVATPPESSTSGRTASLRTPPPPRRRAGIGYELQVLVPSPHKIIVERDVVPNVRPIARLPGRLVRRATIRPKGELFEGMRIIGRTDTVSPVEKNAEVDGDGASRFAATAVGSRSRKRMDDGAVEVVIPLYRELFTRRKGAGGAVTGLGG